MTFFRKSNCMNKNENNVSISKEEWFQISNSLESFHAVFYKIWQMGKPVFTEEIPSACVKFDKQGEFFLFCFNPNFWQELDLSNKLFVICHEALHVILSHGIRSTGFSDNITAANICMDVVVNHMLIRSFGFTKNDLKDAENYCWLDTIFPNCGFSDEESFEFYYNQFKSIYKDGMPGSGEGDCKLVDDHSSMAENWSNAIDSLDQNMSVEEKKSLQNIIEKFGENQEGSGSHESGRWHFKNESLYKPKKKWESVIQNWVKRRLSFEEKEVEQWTKLNRRLTTLKPNLFLPSSIDFEDFYASKEKIEVWFFLDTSGSCFGYSERFLSAAASLPKKRFDVKLFCFDTKIFEIKEGDNKFYGGGGTYFHILEEKILKDTQENLYPDAVFVITDGYGTKVSPKFPKRWHWFLTSNSIKSCIDSKCMLYNLDDFE